jgi:DNA-binding CsgD family transcriptional regulator/sugar-specific transcriptional regulator TrmB
MALDRGAMLGRLGVPADAESIYWAILEHSDWGVAELVAELGIDESTVRDALSTLADYALVYPSTRQPGLLHAVSPQVGLTALLERFEQRIQSEREQIQTTRALILALAASHDDARQRDEILRLDGVDAVRDRLAELARTVSSECMTFTTGSALTPAAITSGMALNLVALQRGVSIRNIYQESILNDAATQEYARWMATHGGQSRTVPMILLRMTIIDRKIALIPIDPDDSSRGAIEVRGGGLMTALCLLFELMWDLGIPFGDPPRLDGNGLNDQEAAVLRLLGQGLTDEAIGRKLGLSERTIRRLVSELMKRLAAKSRFQAGVEAIQRGWL